MTTMVDGWYGVCTLGVNGSEKAVAALDSGQKYPKTVRDNEPVLGGYGKVTDAAFR
jgi:hypothetical protein